MYELYVFVLMDFKIILIMASSTSIPHISHTLMQGKILDLTGHGKPKEKGELSKEGKKDIRGKKKTSTSGMGAMGGVNEDVDSAEADLVAILADQVVKDENKRLRAFRSRKRCPKLKKKISEYKFVADIKAVGVVNTI